MTLLISLVVLSIFAAGYFLLSDSTTSILLVPIPAAIAAVISAISSLVAYFWAPQRYLYIVALINYILFCVTISILITLTGELRSPYLVLLMIMTVFSGLFGWFGLGMVAAGINVSLIYNIFFSGTPPTRDDLLIFLIALETPIAVSYIIWHEKGSQEKKKSQAFDALAKQLSQVANKSEIVINAIADGVIAIDSKGTIQLINPAAQELVGWTKKDAIGLDYKSVFKLADLKGNELDENRSPVNQVLVTNKPIVNNDVTLITNSGKKLLISLVVSPVGDGQQANGAIAVFRDITNEKQEERQKAEFISTASHEMRTPVAAIEGYLGLALNPSTAVIDDKARSYLMKAQESTQHLGRLFQDLLTVSRAEDGRLESKPTVIDMVAFMREISEGLRPKAEAKGLFLYFKPGMRGNTGAEEGIHNISPVYFSFVDQGQLREIANNLIDNAIKYTPQGNVAVDITGDDSTVTVSIADTGMGIPPEDVPHLFQKFYRIDNSATREIGGTGLGLYICRRLAEANNGRIWVESEYGKGSIFYVQMPRISHDKAEELQQKEQVAAQQTTPAVAPQPIPAPAASPQATTPAPAPAPTTVAQPASPIQPPQA